MVRREGQLILTAPDLLPTIVEVWDNEENTTSKHVRISKLEQAVEASHAMSKIAKLPTSHKGLGCQLSSFSWVWITPAGSFKHGKRHMTTKGFNQRSAPRVRFNKHECTASLITT